MVQLCVYTEDTYGSEFIEKVIKWLKKLGKLSQDCNVVKKKHTFGKYNPCNPKLNRIILATFGRHDLYIIFVDAHGKIREMVKDNIKSHIKKSINKFGDKIHIIVFEYEAEEWITASLINQTNEPSQYLKQHYRYDKKEIAKWVDRLDYDKLKNCASFIEFYNALFTVCKPNKVSNN